MLIVAMLALGVAFLSGALYPLRGVVRSWSDGDRSKNQSTVAAMSLVALYGLLFLYPGVAGLFGARLSATTILSFFAVTVLVGTGFAVASLYSKRRAWSLDNELRAASGRPDRRHWMPPLLVGLVWLMGGSIAQVGVPTSARSALDGGPQRCLIRTLVTCHLHRSNGFYRCSGAWQRPRTLSTRACCQ